MSLGTKERINLRENKIQIRVKFWSREEEMRATEQAIKVPVQYSEVISGPLMSWAMVELTEVWEEALAHAASTQHPINSVFLVIYPLLLAVLPPPSLFLKGSSCEHPIAFSPEEHLLVLHKVLVLWALVLRRDMGHGA